MVTKHARDGYVYKERTSGRSPVKLPLFCPRPECQRITSTIDDPHILKYGVCATCYVMCIEGRETPLIDVEYYVQRLKDRGF